jgi:hypothetical protein
MLTVLLFALQVCHGNTARLAKQADDEPLAKVRTRRALIAIRDAL